MAINSVPSLLRCVTLQSTVTTTPTAPCPSKSASITTPPLAPPTAEKMCPIFTQPFLREWGDQHARKLTPAIITAANFTPAPLEPIQALLPEAEFEAIIPLAREIRKHFAAIFGLCDRNYEKYRHEILTKGSPEQKLIFSRTQRPDYTTLVPKDIVEALVDGAKESDLQLTTDSYPYKDMRYPDDMTWEEFSLLLKKYPWNRHDDLAHALYRGDVIVTRATKREYYKYPHQLGEHDACVIKGAQKGHYLKLTRMIDHPRFRPHFVAISKAFEKASSHPGLEEETILYFKKMSSLARRGDLVALHRYALEHPHPRLIFVLSSNLWFANNPTESHFSKFPPSGTIAVCSTVDWNVIEKEFPKPEGVSKTLRDTLQTNLSELKEFQDQSISNLGKLPPPAFTNQPREYHIRTLAHLGDAASTYASAAGLEHGDGAIRNTFVEEFFKVSTTSHMSPEKQHALLRIRARLHEWVHTIDAYNNDTLGTARLPLAEGLAETGSLWQLLKLFDQQWLSEEDISEAIEQTIKVAVIKYMPAEKMVEGAIQDFPHAVGYSIMLNELMKSNCLTFDTETLKINVTNLEAFREAVNNTFTQIIKLITGTRQDFDSYLKAEKDQSQTVLDTVRLLKKALARLQSKTTPPLDPLWTNKSKP